MSRRVVYSRGSVGQPHLHFQCLCPVGESAGSLLLAVHLCKHLPQDAAGFCKVGLYPDLLEYTDCLLRSGRRSYARLPRAIQGDTMKMKQFDIGA